MRRNQMRRITILAGMMLAIILVFSACSSKPTEVVGEIEQESQEGQEGETGNSSDESEDIDNPDSEDADPSGGEAVGESEGSSQNNQDATTNQNQKHSNSTYNAPYHFEYPDAVRGIYVTGHSAGGARFERLLELVNSTQLNAMVIDIKDDHGYLTFRPSQESEYYPFSKNYIKDIHQVLKTLEEHQILSLIHI